MTLPAVHPYVLGVLRDGDPTALLPLVSGGGDWERIAAEASTHALTPLLATWLRRAGAEPRVPPAIGRSFDERRFGFAARNLMLVDELRGILARFDDRGIPCAPLRGPALAERIYGDVGGRPMGDLDLLVRHDDLARVAEVLGDLGFSEMDRRPGFAHAFSYTLKFYKERHGSVIVEPHWSILYPPFVHRIDMDGVWGRCRRRRVLGVETWVLGVADLALHLCLHVAHRGATAPLLWLYELGRLLREEREEIDWARFTTLAVEARCAFLVARVGHDLDALCPALVPAPVLQALERTGAAEGPIVRLLANASLDGVESLSVLFALDGVRSKARYACSLLFPSADFMMLQYGLGGRRQLGLAYARRVCRLSWDALRGIAALL